MGRHHSDSDESYSRSKKKKKRRSRSPSDSPSSDSSRSNRSRKKGKKSHRRRSRSRSLSSSRSYRRSHRRSRSRSPGGRHSRSRSRSYRSYSRSWSRSPKRHKHGSKATSPWRRSRSRGKSRSQSYRKSLSRSPRRKSRTPRRSRTPKRSRRSRSRSRRRYSASPEHRNTSRSPSRSKKVNSWNISDGKAEPETVIPPAKQAEYKLQQALRAAAIADEKLKEAGLLPEGVGRSLQNINLREQHDTGAVRAATIEAIEDEGFTQRHFTSSRGVKASTASTQPTHENAIFGSLTLDMPETDPTKILKAGPCDPKSLMHPVFFEPAEKKTEKWCQKLKAMRNRKLEGEEM